MLNYVFYTKDLIQHIYYKFPYRKVKKMKNSKNIVYKRKQKILQLLRDQKTVNITELSQLLSASPMTIRRDLQDFEENGIVERFYGGANLIEGSLVEDPAKKDLTETSLLRKHAIAMKAASMIENGDTVFINSSSTGLLIYKYLRGKRVVVITNNAKAIEANRDPQVELVLTGGEVYDWKQALVGDFALQTLSKVSATKCILGVSGISAKGGVTTSVLQETAVNELMLKRCNGMRIVIADSSKIGKENNFATCDLELISHLITNSDADPAQIKLIENRGVEVIPVNPIEKIE